MTIFANILRNSQQPTAKDDLQSLNMAATFFATLVPADGPCNYARFMTRMSTTFERIARSVFERDQKTLSVKPTTDSKPRHPKSRAAAQAASQQQQQQQQQQSTSTSTSPPTFSASTSVNIPNLEGLPPINSSGYVVPESPTPSSSPAPTATSHAESVNTSPNPRHNPTKSDPQNHPTLNPPNIQYHNQQHPFPYTTIPTSTSTSTSTSTNPSPTQNPTTTPTPIPNTNINLSFPLPALEEGSYGFSFPFHINQPELWQIPLSADWEFGFGSQFLGNLFGGVNGHGHQVNDNLGGGNGQGYPLNGGVTDVPTGDVPVPETMGASASAPTGAPTGTAPTTAAPVSVPNPLMNGYGYRYPDGSAAHTQAQAHRHSAMWMGGGFPGGPF
ncbi:hypothetical protein BDV06DRAFT_181034 [Aspergillus oleicola]